MQLTLLNTLKSWSNKKLLDHCNNFLLPDLPERNQHIQEKILNGLAIYNSNELRYISNDGICVAISSIGTSNCYEVLVQLNTSDLRVVKPISKIEADGFEIVTVCNYYDEPGIPFFAEIFQNNLNETFICNYIRHVRKLIDVLEQVNCKYPNGPINPYKFIRDKDGLVFNPYIVSLDKFSCQNTKENFLEAQHKQLGYLLFAWKESMNINLDWTIIKQEAKNLWK